jgi:DNA-binding transcriptional LysR family regulator
LDKSVVRTTQQTFTAREALTPENLALLEQVARLGSFAAAARALNLVPSALTYRVRRIEDALDVLLFDRSTRHAKITAAGQELLAAGAQLLLDVDAIASRVKRVATGWEAQLTITADGILNSTVVLELIEAFYQLDAAAHPHAPSGGPPTRIRLREGVLSGTWESLLTGQSDLALGGVVDQPAASGIAVRPMGEVPFVFAVAPHHPLAHAKTPVADAQVRRHRAVAVADTAVRLAPVTVGLLPGQDVLTVPNLNTKLQAHLRGLGCGFLPEPMARPYLQSGRLVAVTVQQTRRPARVVYGWRAVGTPDAPQRADKTDGRLAPRHGHALRWWLAQLDSPVTRAALLGLEAA